jgi:hypothetical protein
VVPDEKSSGSGSVLDFLDKRRGKLAAFIPTG